MIKTFEEKILTVVVIGCGRIGQTHIKNILSHKNYFLKYIIEISGKGISQTEDFLQNTFQTDQVKQIKIVDISDLQKVLEDKDVQGVFVCSPTAFHFEQCKQIAESQKHIFCEKPISLQTQEIRESFETAEKNGVILLCGFNRRHDPLLNEMNQLSKTIGRVHCVMSISRDNPYPPKEYLEKCGGIFHDCAIHDIDLINWIVGSKPTTVSVDGIKVQDQTSDPFNLDDVIISLNYKEKNVNGRINASRISTFYDQRLEIFGTEKDINIRKFKTNPIDIQSSNSERCTINMQIRYAESFKNEIQHFYEVVCENKEPKVKKQDCVNANLIADACKRAYESKKTEFIRYE